MANNVVDNELLRAEFQDGVSQVSDELVITELDSVFESATRTLRTSFKIVNKETNETIEIDNAMN